MSPVFMKLLRNFYFMRAFARMQILKEFRNSIYMRPSRYFLRCS